MVRFKSSTAVYCYILYCPGLFGGNVNVTVHLTMSPCPLVIPDRAAENQPVSKTPT